MSPDESHLPTGTNQTQWNKKFHSYECMDQIKKFIDQLAKAKSESSHLIHDLSEARGNNKHLNEEITNLQKEIADLSFQDITDGITDIQQNENPQADKLSSVNKSALQDTHNKSREMKVVQPSNEEMKFASESSDMDTHS
ncbi:Hypothetical predicted protein [Mytilus galloprovincialis]|uniref:Uncharacterized protein n=2 Tax=Mytilus galloprovincialis TaxID=29158 RepID=A0A8B6GN36_MYTGA|nr:Hypothetical predicted protein [Mytilus galloprovincialis]